MKRFLLIAILLSGPGLQLGFGQDFKKVVDIVVDMEISLKKMISQEQEQRKTEFASLRTEVQVLRASLSERPTQAIAAASTFPPELLARIESLEQRLTELKPAPDMAFLAEKLSSLLGELKKSVEDTKTSQASAQKALAAIQQSTQVGGQVFAFYSYTTTGIEGNDFNRFDLDRMYLTAKAQVFEGGKLQFTSDLFRNSAAGSYYGGLALRIKFAFLDYAPSASVSIKLGMVPAMWPGFVDGYWKYRGISPTVSDRSGYFSTADLGVSISYLLPGKMGELSAFILNGSGYTSPETNRFKDLGLRASFSPFQNEPFLKQLTVAGYVYKGSNLSTISEALQRDRFGAFAGYGYSIATFGVEYNLRREAPANPDTVVSGSALSLFGEIKAPFEELKNALSLVWRYDVVEPNIDKGGDMARFAITGIAYKPNEKLTFVLNRQWTLAETASLKSNDGTKTDRDSRWFIHTIINF